MGELRHLLGALSTASARPEPDCPYGPGTEDQPQLAPQPGLAQLDALLDNVRAAGQPVTLHSCAADLPPIVELTIYRVVQEALTNALRYAPGAATTVTIAQDEDAILVEVVDDGVPDTTPATTGAGSGLLGLAERLALHGASLETGRRAGGGFRVAARIPMAAS
jgi:signal transduction histidine kinase